MFTSCLAPSLDGFTFPATDAHRSCAAMKAASPIVASGFQQIDPDGDGPIAPFNAYCDMESDDSFSALTSTPSVAEAAPNLAIDSSSPMTRRGLRFGSRRHSSGRPIVGTSGVRSRSTAYPRTSMFSTVNATCSVDNVRSEVVILRRKSGCDGRRGGRLTDALGVLEDLRAMTASASHS